MADPTTPPQTKKAPRRSGGSFGSRGNYNRLMATFGPAAAEATIPTDYRRADDGNWFRWNGTAWIHTPEGPAAVRPEVSDVRPFVAAEALNKVLILSVIALISGIGAAVVNLPVGAAFILMIAALVVAVVTIFRPRRAPILAPIYAVLEGAVLGVISQLFSGGDQKLVVLAVIGTSAVFLAVLVSYRTGLVRVTNNFLRATIFASVGLIAVMLAVLLFGLTIPHTSQGTTYVVVFGVLYLIVAVMDLFVDFNFTYQAERAGISHEGEWFAAFSIMLAVVMIYLSLIRIFSGGGRR